MLSLENPLFETPLCVTIDRYIRKINSFFCFLNPPLFSVERSPLHIKRLKALIVNGVRVSTTNGPNGGRMSITSLQDLLCFSLNFKQRKQFFYSNLLAAAFTIFGFTENDLLEFPPIIFKRPTLDPLYLLTRQLDESRMSIRAANPAFTSDICQ